MQATRFTDHWFYLWPIWGGSSTPYGKGLDYLASCEAKDAESLAKSQLAGLKLLALAAFTRYFKAQPRRCSWQRFSATCITT
jgi:hypothetical protein